MKTWDLRSEARPHLYHATLQCLLMHFHIYVMLRCCVVSCTCTSSSCYAAVFSHALTHLRPSALPCCFLHFYLDVMLRCCVFSCTCTSTCCYAAVFFHALPHLRHVTLLCCLMHVYFYVMRCPVRAAFTFHFFKKMKVELMMKWLSSSMKLTCWYRPTTKSIRYKVSLPPQRNARFLNILHFHLQRTSWSTETSSSRRRFGSGKLSHQPNMLH